MSAINSRESKRSRREQRAAREYHPDVRKQNLPIFKRIKGVVEHVGNVVCVISLPPIPKRIIDANGRKQVVYHTSPVKYA